MTLCFYLAYTGSSGPRGDGQRIFSTGTNEGAGKGDRVPPHGVGWRAAPLCSTLHETLIRIGYMLDIDMSGRV
jgi:hypothetical protein